MFHVRKDLGWLDASAPRPLAITATASRLIMRIGALQRSCSNDCGGSESGIMWAAKTGIGN